MARINLTRVGRAGSEPEPYEVDAGLVRHTVTASPADAEHFPGSRTVVWVGPGPGLDNAAPVHVSEFHEEVEELLEAARLEEGDA